MADDHAQRTLEQKALANVRARLDRQDPDASARSVEEAAAHAGKTAPLVLGVVALVVGLTLAHTAWRERANDLPVPKTRAEYAANVARRAELGANRNDARSIDGLRGRVQVSVVVRPTGYIEDIQVTQSSHDARVDGQAKRFVKLGEPYGPFPEGAGREFLRVRGTWRFDGSSATFTLDP